MLKRKPKCRFWNSKTSQNISAPFMPSTMCRYRWSPAKSSSDGRQRRRQVHLGQDHRRNFRPTHGRCRWRDGICRCTGRSKPASTASRSCIRISRFADNLSAAANVFLGREMRKGVGPFRFSTMPRCIAAPGRSLPSCEARRGRAIWSGKMSGGQRQAVAIARTRIADARIVLMDEPTAAISVRASPRKFST